MTANHEPIFSAQAEGISHSAVPPGHPDAASYSLEQSLFLLRVISPIVHTGTMRLSDLYPPAFEVRVQVFDT